MTEPLVTYLSTGNDTKVLEKSKLYLTGDITNGQLTKATMHIENPESADKILLKNFDTFIHDPTTITLGDKQITNTLQLGPYQCGPKNRPVVVNLDAFFSNDWKDVENTPLAFPTTTNLEYIHHKYSDFISYLKNIFIYSKSTDNNNDNDNNNMTLNPLLGDITINEELANWENIDKTMHEAIQKMNNQTTILYKKEGDQIKKATNKKAKPMLEKIKSMFLQIKDRTVDVRPLGQLYHNNGGKPRSSRKRRKTKRGGRKLHRKSRRRLKK